MANLDEYRAAYANSGDEYHALFAWAMALEDKYLAEGTMNEHAHRNRDLTDWVCRNGAIKPPVNQADLVRQGLRQERIDRGLPIPDSLK